VLCRSSKGANWIEGIGEARDDFRKIHAIATYDFELDSTDSLDRNVAMLLSSTR